MYTSKQTTQVAISFQLDTVKYIQKVHSQWHTFFIYLKSSKLFNVGMILYHIDNIMSLFKGIAYLYSQLYTHSGCLVWVYIDTFSNLFNQLTLQRIH